MTKKIHLLAGISVCLLWGIVLSSCGRTPAIDTDMDRMCGEWTSVDNRPAMSVFKEGGFYKVTVYRKGNHSGKIFPATYLLTQNGENIFIEAGFRCAVGYSKGDDRLFLSPGGEFVRSQKENLSQQPSKQE